MILKNLVYMLSNSQELSVVFRTKNYLGITKDYTVINRRYVNTLDTLLSYQAHAYNTVKKLYVKDNLLIVIVTDLIQ